MKNLNIKTGSKQKGFTVIEIVAVLAVAIIILGLVVPKLMSGNNALAEQTINDHVISLANGAKKWRGIRPNYTGVTCAALINDDYVDQPWANCNGVNPEGGNYTVAPNGGNPNDLTITATGLTAEVCNRVERNLETSVLASGCAGGTLTVTFDG